MREVLWEKFVTESQILDLPRGRHCYEGDIAMREIGPQ